MTRPVSIRVASTQSSRAGSVARYPEPATPSWMRLMVETASRPCSCVPNAMAYIGRKVRRSRPKRSSRNRLCSATARATSGCAICIRRARPPPSSTTPSPCTRRTMASSAKGSNGDCSVLNGLAIGRLVRILRRMNERTVVHDVEEEAGPGRPSIIIISDFVCPWCYIGLVEVERLKQEYEFDVHFAPYLLRPETPPEGMLARRIIAPDAPLTPMEQRAADLGINFKRGRTTTSYSHLALEAAEFAFQYSEDPWRFHRRLFGAYFEELQDIGDIDVLVRLAEEMGVDGVSLREALNDRHFESEVDEGIAWSREIGVTAIPTFVFNERQGMVGAQELPAFREMMQRVGNLPRA